MLSPFPNFWANVNKKARLHFSENQAFDFCDHLFHPPERMVKVILENNRPVKNCFGV
jgi:hypothetical protein